MIVIEKQPASVPPASRTQPNQHSTYGRVKNRWAIYVGVSAFLVISSAVLWLRPHAQTGVTSVPSHTESGSTQQSNLQETEAEQSNSETRNSHANPERSVASNPFSSDNNNPFLTAPKDQSLDPRPKNYRSLPNGKRLSEDSDVTGHGELSISNQTSLDAVVRVYNPSTLETVRWFFVKAHGSVEVTWIPQGNYNLAYTSGLDWVDSDEAFRWNPSYFEFERPLIYSEQIDTNRIRYSKFSVTLHPVIGGNAKTKPISRNEFLKGHRRPSM
jgi:hypothetical protein